MLCMLRGVTKPMYFVYICTYMMMYILQGRLNMTLSPILTFIRAKSEYIEEISGFFFWFINYKSCL